jgi:hypothetical protein
MASESWTDAAVPADVSLTHFPDISGAFVLHSNTGSGLDRSPGTRVDGTPHAAACALLFSDDFERGSRGAWAVSP